MNIEIDLNIFSPSLYNLGRRVEMYLCRTITENGEIKGMLTY